MATVPRRPGIRRPKPKTSTFTTADYVRRDGPPPAELAQTLKAMRENLDPQERDDAHDEPRR